MGRKTLLSELLHGSPWDSPGGVAMKRPASLPAFNEVVSSKRYRAIALTVTFTTVLCLFLFHAYHEPHPESFVQSPAATYKLMTPIDNVDLVSQRIDWSRFAYTQYAMDSEYICNAVIFFDSLKELGSRADRVLMYPSHMFTSEEDLLTSHARLLIKARKELGVKLVPVDIQQEDHGDKSSAAYTKLLAFNQTQYERVLSVDSDSLLLNHMDELFLLPPVPVAAPRAYWLSTYALSTHLLLVQPSETQLERISKNIQKAADDRNVMDIFNELYKTEASILPHRKYTMLSSEFRDTEHAMYLGSDFEAWDPVSAYNEAKLIHFSDTSMPKPWISASNSDVLRLEPKCVMYDDHTGQCHARQIWRDLYKQFQVKRNRVCGLGSEGKRVRPGPGVPSAPVGDSVVVE